MRFVIVECHSCQKKIIKLVENEKGEEGLMSFCRVHFKYICKNCERIFGRCHICSKVFCKDCKIHSPDGLRIFCDDCFKHFEKKHN